MIKSLRLVEFVTAGIGEIVLNQDGAFEVRSYLYGVRGAMCPVIAYNSDQGASVGSSVLPYEDEYDDRTIEWSGPECERCGAPCGGRWCSECRSMELDY